MHETAIRARIQEYERLSGAVRFREFTRTERSGNDGLFEQRLMGCVTHGVFTERPCALVNKGADE